MTAGAVAVARHSYNNRSNRDNILLLLGRLGRVKCVGGALSSPRGQLSDGRPYKRDNNNNNNWQRSR